MTSRPSWKIKKSRKMRKEGMTLPCGCPAASPECIQRTEARRGNRRAQQAAAFPVAGADQAGSGERPVF